MPVESRYDIPGGRILLWRITESEEELRPLVTDADYASCGGMTNLRRRLQRLAWRAALRSVLPEAGEVVYNDAGAPFVRTGEHISVSHSRDYVAVMISERRCALDMELYGRDFTRLYGRIVSPQEAELPVSGDPRFPAAIWCAKEALYKMFDHKSLGLDDVRIVSVELPAQGVGRMTAWADGRGPVALTILPHDKVCIVYC